MTDGIPDTDIPVRVHRRFPERRIPRRAIIVGCALVVALLAAIPAFSAAPQGRYTLTITHTMGESTTPGLTAMQCQHAVMSAQVTVARLPGAETIRAICKREPS